MGQQLGERWDEIEDMNDDYKGYDDHEGEDGKEDVAEDERDSQMLPQRQTIVIDISLSHFSCLEEC